MPDPTQQTYGYEGLSGSGLVQLFEYDPLTFPNVFIAVNGARGDYTDSSGTHYGPGWSATLNLRPKTTWGASADSYSESITAFVTGGSGGVSAGDATIDMRNFSYSYGNFQLFLTALGGASTVRGNASIRLQDNSFYLNGAFSQIGLTANADNSSPGTSGTQSITLYRNGFVSNASNNIVSISLSGAYAPASYTGQFDATLNENHFDLGAGSDVLMFMMDGGARLHLTSNQFDGGSGLDVISFEDAQGVDVDLFRDGIHGFEVVMGGSGDDTFRSFDEDVTFMPGGGNNHVTGGTGRDTFVMTTTGHDEYDGIMGSAIDTLDLSQSTRGATVHWYGDVEADGTARINLIERIFGTDFDDMIEATNIFYNDLIGGLGNDILDAHGSPSLLEGGPGDDQITGFGDSTVVYGRGDEVIANPLTGGVRVYLDVELVPQDTVNFGNDTLFAIRNVWGTNGWDTLGGNGDGNTMLGFAGNDLIDGKAGNDIIDGGSGNDRLIGGAGFDDITGGAGTDTAVYSGNMSQYRIEYVVVGGRNAVKVTDLFAFNSDYDILHGIETLEFADQSISVRANNHPGIGANPIPDQQAGDGLLWVYQVPADAFADPDGDALIYTAALSDGSPLPSWLSFNGTTGTFSGSPPAISIGATLNIKVTASDNMPGDAASVVSDIFQLRIIASIGADIAGTGGADVIAGTDRPEQMFGGDGNDTLLGSPGADRLDGQTGTDIASFASSPAGVTVNLLAGTGSGGYAEGDTFASIESVTGSAFGDTLIGDANANTLTGGDGNDTLDGLGGVDVLRGGEGNDTIIVSEAASGETYDGGNGFDTLELRTATVPLYQNTATSIEQVRFTAEVGAQQALIVSISQLAGSPIGSLIGSAGTDVLILASFAPGGTYSVPALSLTNWDTAAPIGQNSDVVLLQGVVPGNYTLNARDGLASRQYLLGGPGDDVLNGSNGSDYLDGNAGVNQLRGNGGDDLLMIFNSFVTVSGGVVPTAYTGAGSTFDGGTGTDLLGIGGFVNFDGTLTGMEGIFLLPSRGNPGTAGSVAQAQLSVPLARLAPLGSAFSVAGTGQIDVRIDTATNVDFSGVTFAAGTQAAFSFFDYGITQASGLLTWKGTSVADYFSLQAGITNIALTLGGGADVVEMNANAFVGGNKNIRVTITDFVSGVDKLDFYDAQHFIGAAAFSGIVGQVRVGTSGGVSFAEVDANGDGLADIHVDLPGAGVLAASDFVVFFQRGTPGNDLLDANENSGGGADPVTYSGGDGNDTLRGGSAADSLSGGNGNDAIYGGNGNDTIIGGGGADMLFGEGGNDTVYLPSSGSLVIDGGTGTDTLEIIANTVMTGTLAGFEVAHLANANLTLTGTQFIQGFATNSSFTGTGAVTVNLSAAQYFFATQMTFAPGVALTVNALTGTNVVKVALGSAVTINGGDGIDQLRGSNLADVIRGGAGNDKIMGLGGADVLTGGAGSDQFRWLFTTDSGLGAAADHVTDFLAGTDKIDLRLLDANPAAPGRQSVTYIGSSAFHGAGVAEVHHVVSGANMLVEVDLDGNGTADMQLVLEGAGAQVLSASDFLLTL